MRQSLLINPYLNLLPSWVAAFNFITAAGIRTLNVLSEERASNRSALGFASTFLPKLLHEHFKIVSIQNISQLIDCFATFCSAIAITLLEHLGHITSVCLVIHFMAMTIVSQS